MIGVSTLRRSNTEPLVRLNVEGKGSGQRLSTRERNCGFAWWDACLSLTDNLRLWAVRGIFRRRKKEQN